MLASTLLMSAAPKPVAVRLCFGRLKPGPTGPTNVEMGAPMESFRSLGALSTVAAAAAAIFVEVALTQRRYEGREISQKVYIRSKLRRYFVEGGSVGSELGALQRFSFSNPAFSGA
jgi:hypothetical protein